MYMYLRGGPLSRHHRHQQRLCPATKVQGAAPFFVTNTFISIAQSHTYIYICMYLCTSIFKAVRYHTIVAINRAVAPRPESKVRLPT